MVCPRCQQDAPSDAVFCPKCGAKLSVGCPQCGAANAPDDNFCRKCGARVTVSTQPTATRFAAPESYTPKHLAERILTSRAALEGERKQVTVLFADLKGSMELLADRDPEEARRLLDPVVERMMEAVHHYEGTVNQVMGDGIMALFGAPIGHEDHAVRGCYAAVRMQRRVALYADEIQRAGGTPVQIRVGLNSGEVVVRAIGSDLRMDYTAVGQTTHLAARMEQMAKPGSALITGETLNLAEGHVQVRPLGAVPVKGLELPTPVYELTGIVPARSRFQASAARGLTRFVGRDRELQQLAQAVDRAGAGHGQVVAVVGEAGLGKSRLVWEFTRSDRTHGWLVLESGSVSRERLSAGALGPPHLGAVWPDAAAGPSLPARQDLGHLGGDGQPHAPTARVLLPSAPGEHHPGRGRGVPAAAAAPSPRSHRPALGWRLHPRRRGCAEGARPPSAPPGRTLPRLRPGTQSR